MKLTLRKLFRYDCFDELMDIFAKKGTSIELAYKLESRLNDFKYYILGLLTIRANLFESTMTLANYKYAIYNDYQLLDEIKLYFAFNEQKDNIHALSDEDYIAIANMRFSGRYDRCIEIIVKREYSSQPPCSFVYKIVVDKGIGLTSDQTVSYEEICELQKSNSIQIVSITSKKRRSRALLNIEEQWLSFCERTNNIWHRYYISYVKDAVTSELLDDCIMYYCNHCNNLFELPSDEFMRRRAKYYNKYGEAFKTLSSEEIIKLIKDFVVRTKILDEAKDIISNHSETYKSIMSLHEKLVSSY